MLQAEYQRGFAAGRRQAEDSYRTEAAEQLESERQRITQLVSASSQQLTDLFRLAEEATVKFAFGIAERVIRREVSLDRSIVVGQIKEAVRRVLGVETVKIRVHAQDLPLVKEQKSSIQAGGDAIREIIVEEDESLERGDCIIESEMGNIDARIATQLKQVENVLFESTIVT